MYRAVRNFPLHDAVSSGNIERVTEILDDYDDFQDINERHDRGETALFLAANFDYVDIVSKLILNFADLKIPSEYEPYLGYTPLHIAVNRGHSAVVKLLLCFPGCPINICERSEGSTPLHLAVIQGNVNIVHMLLAHKECYIDSLDKSGRTPLILAALHPERLDIFICLVQNGADMKKADFDGATALHAAAGNGNLAIVRILLEEGSDPNMCVNGETPLNWASYETHKDVIELLLKHGAHFGPGKTLPSELRQHKENEDTSECGITAVVSSKTTNTQPSNEMSLRTNDCIGSHETATEDTNGEQDDEINHALSKIDLTSDKSTDVFLTHDWGTDETGISNHSRVSIVNSALKDLGYRTWFDEERMEGNIQYQMCQGIDNAKVVLVFVTANYMQKVSGEHQADNCFLEFSYACRKKTPALMLPVVMETGMKNARAWNGLLGMNLGGTLYVNLAFDFADSNKFHSAMGELQKQIDVKLEKVVRS